MVDASSTVASLVDTSRLCKLKCQKSSESSSKSLTRGQSCDITITHARTLRVIGACCIFAGFDFIDGRVALAQGGNKIFSRNLRAVTLQSALEDARVGILRTVAIQAELCIPFSLQYLSDLCRR